MGVGAGGAPGSLAVAFSCSRAPSLPPNKRKWVFGAIPTCRPRPTPPSRGFPGVRASEWGKISTERISGAGICGERIPEKRISKERIPKARISAERICKKGIWWDSSP